MLWLLDNTNFLAEGGEGFFVEILLVKDLDGHIFGSTSTFVNSTEGTISKNTNLFYFWDFDLWRAVEVLLWMEAFCVTIFF